MTFFPSLNNLLFKASFDKRRIWYFLLQCRIAGKLRTSERLNLFYLSTGTVRTFSDKELYSALTFGGKKRRLALASIRKNKGVSLVKNRFKNARLFVLGEFHFNHLCFIDKLKKMGVETIDSLKEKPTHIILGSNIPRNLFMEAMRYADREKVSFMEESYFFDKYLKDKDQYKALLNTPEMQDNLFRLLNNKEHHNILLGLQLLLPIGLPKQEKWLKRLVALALNYPEDIKKYVEDIRMLNGVEDTPEI